MNSNFRYDINALRALSVIGVLIFHINRDYLPSGFAGVDVFFVISGYLMTAIISSRLNKGSFSYIDFMHSRFARIVPALLVLSGSLMIAGWFYLPTTEYFKLAENALSSALFYSNVFYWMEVGYFTSGAYDNWLLHTWSLSVEWQFYMLFPFLLLALNQLFSAIKVFLTFVVCTCIALSISIYLTIHSPDAAYFLLPARAYEMMLGGICYFYLQHQNSSNALLLRFPIITQYLGVALIVTSFFLFSESTMWPGFWALFPTIGCALVLISNYQKSRFSQNVILQKLGLWSYSIYLWHWPLVVYMYETGYTSVKAIVVAMLSITLGYASYSIVENRRVWRTKFRSIVFLYAGVICLISFTLFTSGGDVGVRQNLLGESASYQEKYLTFNYVSAEHKSKIRDECNFLDTSNDTARVESGIADCALGGFGGVFLWGDSHAQALSFGIRQVLPKDTVFNQVTSSSCPPMVNGDHDLKGEFKIACNLSNEFARKKILEIKPSVIVLAQRNKHTLNEYTEILAFLDKHDLSTKVLLVGPTPQWNVSLTKLIAKKYFSPSIKRIDDPTFDESTLINGANLHAKYRDKNIIFVSLTDYLCNQQGCLVKIDNQNTPIIYDYGHLTAKGSIFVSTNIIGPVLLELLDK
ncbi:acyltransferase family protein [Brumicola blandensis]|uniref:Acyltransferase family protein n=1 Tax=Brumicola blandensis TaxID=3075611 RepID=A0AAW8R3H8_9ALTE|nr:acyltransferase family protein [Alteromonas sp. W409]MDT0582638.1 acyltransferase family protein [Alteromonas sp. W409]